MKFTLRHLLLIFPLIVSLSCEDLFEKETEPEPELTELPDPNFELVELTVGSVKVKWDSIDTDAFYQITGHLVDSQGFRQEMPFRIGPGQSYHEYHFEQFPYCRDSVELILNASKTYFESGNTIFSSDTLRFRVPNCEYKLVLRETGEPYYCQFPMYSRIAVEILNVSYGTSYDFSREEMDWVLTSNMATIDAQAEGPYLTASSGWLTVHMPVLSTLALCDGNPDTDIIEMDLSVKDRETGDDIPGSPMHFEVGIN